MSIPPDQIAQAPRQPAAAAAAPGRAAVDADGDGAVFLLDPSGAVASWNAAAERITGYQPEEILGRPFALLYPAADADAPQRLLQRALADGCGADGGHRLRRDGSPFEAAVTVSPLFGRDRAHLGYAATLSVVSGRQRDEQAVRQRAEAALRACEERYRTLFEHAQLGVVLADAESRYLDANAAACRMLGYERDELIGLHAEDIIAETELAQVRPTLRALHARADHHREWQFRRKDGSVFPADVIATRLPDGTILGLLRDLSDRELADTYREHLVAIVESSRDAIIGQDLDGIVTSWNAGAEAMFGYAAAEMIGTSIARLVPDVRREEEARILAQLRRGERVEAFETQRRTRDGRLIDVSVAISPIRDGAGRIVGASKIARDITVLKEREREIARLSRLYAARSRVGQAIVWAPTRAELFARVCRALVDQGGFRMAWIGWHEPDSHRLVPVAVCGDDDDYLQRVEIYADDRPAGRGPSGIAFRSGRAYICNDIGADPATLPWRPQLDRRGFRASAAFPIRMQGAVCGTLSVYADQRDVFHDREIALLEEAATDVSFAIDNLARDEARRQAEEAVRREQRFSDAMLESMPGILYFYDSQRRFLRWNRNFETASGYSAAEIAGMHPLDFFAGEDKARVEARIAEVFASGESSVEASFVAKDGRTQPHFFTGKHVEFDGRSCLIGVGIDISDRRRAENRLAESERKYRELVEHANSIILRWDTAGHVTFLNEFGQRFFGYPAGEILGRHLVGTIVPPTESGGRDLGKLIDEICAHPEAFEQNVNENVRRSGERVWIAWTNRVERDAHGGVVGFLSVGTDITERRQAEAKLRESEAHLVEAQRIARIGSWELDLHSNRLRWSDQIYELFGIPKSILASTYEAFLDFVHPDDRARVQAAQQAALAGGARLDLEHRIVLRDGSEKVVHELADLRRDAQGQAIALAGTVHDVTDRRRIEAEREKRQRAEAADRIKSAFLATMSHELRTPLNSIIGFTGIVLQELAGPLTDEQRKQLGMVRGSARHLLELINDVLDISKIEAGQLEVRAERVDLAAVLERATASVQPLAAHKHLTLTTHLPPVLPEMVSDRRRVEQILLNLLNNAIKFTDEGGVTLTVELLDAYQATAEAPAGPAVRMRVTDTGIGMKPGDLDLLFQPFRQLDTGLTRQHEGTGLGLAICRRLAGLLGGDITARSEWQHGSEFTLVLPVERA